jgi:hypothetical protein
VTPLPPEDRPFPTPAQLDLLRAALLPAPAAAAAWRRWNERGMRLEVLDQPSHRMLSQLWTNREAAAIDPRDRPLLKGVYRQVLAENALVLSAGLDAVRTLEASQIPVVLIKGPAFLAFAGGHLGLRKTTDMDVLVPERDHAVAARVLMDIGYRPKGGQSDVVLARRAWSGYDQRGFELDLHWWGYKTAGDDSCVFADARPSTLLGRPVLIPSPSEMLCSTIANAVVPGDAAPMRWIGDAMTLLSPDGVGVDWSVIVARAIARELTLPIGAGLQFLATELGAPVPSGALRELAAVSTSRRARWSHRMALSPGSSAWLFMEMERHRAVRAHVADATPRDILGYLKQVRGDPTRRAYVQRKATDVIGSAARRRRSAEL